MITIFYCTRNKDEKYFKHIQNTCGVENAEIICMENDGSFGLAEAYNKGLRTAKNDIILFIHDDLKLPKSWGYRFKQYFDNSDYGILGIAGTTDLHASGQWWTNKQRMCGRVWHEGEVHGKKRRWESKYSGRYPKKILPVVCIDGLLMGVNRERLKEDFDEDFEGFHFYDIPFCVRNHSAGVKIGVVTDQKVLHRSVGETNQQWADNRAKFAAKYAGVLPARITPDIHVEHFSAEDEEPKLNRYPTINVVIPHKEKNELLFQCLKSFFKHVAYPPESIKIIIADTGSSEEKKAEIRAFIESLKSMSDMSTFWKESISMVEYDYYNFAKINNDVVKNHVDPDCELLLFCNNDIELLNDAVSFMVRGYLSTRRVGTIGCRLHFADKTVQHGGIQPIINKNQLQLTHKGARKFYTASWDTEKDVFGCTGAFLMVQKSLFDKIGGFNEDTLECIEDVILNIDAILHRRKNIYVGEAVCYHYESSTRNDNPEKVANTTKDLQNVFAPKLQRHSRALKKYIQLIK